MPPITYLIEQNLIQENEFYKKFCQTYGNGLTEKEYELISLSINNEFNNIVFTVRQSNFTNKTQILEEVHDIVFNQDKDSSKMITTNNKKLNFLLIF